MTDNARESDPPDTDFMARLIGESSLGSPDALLAQAEVSPPDTMRLRDRVHLDTGARRWDSTPESASVLLSVGGFYPRPDGTLSVPTELPTDRRAFVRNARGDYREMTSANPTVPPGGRHDRWNVYVEPATTVWRCTLTCVTRPDVGLPVEADAAVWWKLTDLEQAVAAGFATITPRILADSLAIVLQRPLAADGGIFTPKGHLLLEQVVEEQLKARGVTAECAVRIQPGRPFAPPTPMEPAGPNRPAVAANRAAAGSNRPAGPSFDADHPLDSEAVSFLRDAMRRLRDSREPMSPLPESAQLLAERLEAHAAATKSAIRDILYQVAGLMEALRVYGLQIDDAARTTDRVIMKLASMPTFLELIARARSRDTVELLLAMLAAQEMGHGGRPEPGEEGQSPRIAPPRPFGTSDDDHRRWFDDEVDRRRESRYEFEYLY